MTWDEAVARAIKHYYGEDESHAKYTETNGAFKYTPSYFDKIESELISKPEPKEPKK